MEIKDRIDEFIALKGLTVKAFEKEIGISNGLWTKAKTLSEDVLLKTIAHYPEINSDWLLKGKGNMFGPIDGESSISDTDAELIKLSRELVDVVGKIMNFKK